MSIFALMAAGCVTTPATPTVDASPAVDPTIVPLPPGPYYEVIWASDDIVAAASSGDAVDRKLEYFDSSGAKLGDVSLDDAEVCYVRTVLGLSRLPSGGFAFTNACQRPPTFDPMNVGHVYAIDPATAQRRELPRPVGIPGRMAWSADEAELTYEVGLSLCETLYRQTPTSDGPLAISVVIDGQTVWLGENTTDEKGQCPESGRARAPAINPTDGALAAFVQPARGRSGQGRIDLPWSLVVVSDGVAEVVLGGLRYAVCLAWTDDGDLLFSADLAGYNPPPDGLYQVHRDGTGLRQIGTRALGYCSLSPDGSTLIGTDIGSFPPPDDPNAPNAILSYSIAKPNGQAQRMAPLVLGREHPRLRTACGPRARRDGGGCRAAWPSRAR